MGDLELHRNLSMCGVKGENHLRIVSIYNLRMVFPFALLMKKFLDE